jgi:uncharacterized membrane protein YgdD (TMEM256/DUF423 family)
LAKDAGNSFLLNTLNNRLALNVAGFLGFSGVLLGAFGAHLLRDLLERLGTAQSWRTAVLYHLVHAVVLLVLAGWRPIPRLSYCLILFGVIVFSGSLYALALTNLRWFGAVTPLGGLGMLLGWLSLGLSKRNKSG